METDIQQTAAQVLDRNNQGVPASGARLLARLHREGFIVAHVDEIPHKDMTAGAEALGWNLCRAWLIKHHGGGS